MNYIIEGIDNIGKSTLIDYIENVEGYKFKIHHSQPQITDSYPTKKEYAEASISAGFELLATNENIIFDRFHLGEIVYSGIYRDYNTDFVMQHEKHCIHNPFGNITKNTILVLLLSTDMQHIKDDGNSINHNNSKIEQDCFLQAYNDSKLNKIIIWIDKNNGTRKTTKDIYSEILKY